MNCTLINWLHIVKAENVNSATPCQFIYSGLQYPSEEAGAMVAIPVLLSFN